MEFEQVILIQDKKIFLRTLNEQDVQQLLRFQQRLLLETPYLLPTSVQELPSLKQSLRQIQSYMQQDNAFCLGAFDLNQLVGICYFNEYGKYKKIAHRCTFEIAIMKQFQRKGIGKKMLSMVLAYAKQLGYQQIEISVQANNLDALWLYQQFSFEVWGTIPKAFWTKDGYQDELILGKVL